MLLQAGARLTLPALRELLAGVIAAPGAVDPEGWIALVADDPPPALRAALLRLEVAMRAESADGLGVRPAPAERLAAVRAELNRRGVDGFLVPLADEHQSEFPPARARRLEWLTGFGGSAGLAIVLRERPPRLSPPCFHRLYLNIGKRIRSNTLFFAYVPVCMNNTSQMLWYN